MECRRRCHEEECGKSCYKNTTRFSLTDNTTGDDGGACGRDVYSTFLGTDSRVLSSFPTNLASREMASADEPFPLWLHKWGKGEVEKKERREGLGRKGSSGLFVIHGLPSSSTSMKSRCFRVSDQQQSLRCAVAVMFLSLVFTSRPCMLLAEHNGTVVSLCLLLQ